eukprot:1303090-Amphidinium_carterae.1
MRAQGYTTLAALAYVLPPGETSAEFFDAFIVTISGDNVDGEYEALLRRAGGDKPVALPPPGREARREAQRARLCNGFPFAVMLHRQIRCIRGCTRSWKRTSCSLTHGTSTTNALRRFVGSDGQGGV